MALPDLSNSMYVARLRHIQAIHESPERRNPDTLVRRFIPILQRLRTAWLGQDELSKLRSDPFYYYLVARTLYYDQIIMDAVADGVERIVGVGCGSDTRAYRFKDLLCRSNVRVLECDQADAIRAKTRLTKRWGQFDYIEHMPIDLNDTTWPALGHWLGGNLKPRTLVCMEGVSPYVESDTFGWFLEFLASRLAPGSTVAYDFKLTGVKDDFGRVGRTQRPFRLPAASQLVAAFHDQRGLQMKSMELSSELCARLIPSLDESITLRFQEDGLLQLRVPKGKGV